MNQLFVANRNKLPWLAISGTGGPMGGVEQNGKLFIGNGLGAIGTHRAASVDGCKKIHAAFSFVTV
jgi:hypothetical protein